MLYYNVEFGTRLFGKTGSFCNESIPRHPTPGLEA
jgi:hypothetical protein